VDLRYIRETYGYPHMVGHRSSLAGSLFEACQKEASIKFHFCAAGAEVASWTPKPTIKIQPREGEAYTITPDVLLAADGLKSNIRDQMLTLLSIDAHIVDTNQAAYRIMLNRSQMDSDPELLEL